MPIANYFSKYPFHQGDHLSGTGVPQASGGMCLMLAINWLLRIGEEGDSSVGALSWISSNKHILKQIAGQQRFYSSEDFYTSFAPMVKLASNGRYIAGGLDRFTLSDVSSVISGRINGRGLKLYLCWFLCRGGAHAIGFAIDKFGVCSIFDPNYGVCVIRENFSGNIEGAGLYGILISELQFNYRIDSGEIIELWKV